MSEWTVETLKAHFDETLQQMDLRYQQRYDAQQKALEAALLAQEKAVATAMTASEKAVIKAEGAAEKRFDAVNEFRGAYQDIIALQMPRVEADQRFITMGEKIDELKLVASANSGRTAGMNAAWIALVAAVGTIATIIAVIGSR